MIYELYILALKTLILQLSMKSLSIFTQSAGAVEYANCISAERPLVSCGWWPIILEILVAEQSLAQQPKWSSDFSPYEDWSNLLTANVKPYYLYDYPLHIFQIVLVADNAVSSKQQLCQYCCMDALLGR